MNNPPCPHISPLSCHWSLRIRRRELAERTLFHVPSFPLLACAAPHPALALRIVLNETKQTGPGAPGAIPTRGRLAGGGRSPGFREEGVSLHLPTGTRTWTETRLRSGWGWKGGVHLPPPFFPTPTGNSSSPSARGLCQV